MQRRQFLQAGSAGVTQALVVGFSFTPSAAGAKSMRKEAAEAWLAVDGNGSFTVYTGKVDLGTGIRTAFTQMVADELEVPMQRVVMVMGDTATTIDQGQTASSVSISAGGQQLRRACATARHALAARAAAQWGVSPQDVQFPGDGTVRLKSDATRSATYASLLPEGLRNLEVDGKAALKKPAEHRFVGKSVQRLDIPAKVTGEFTYVHDVKLPDMVHARVIRPAGVMASLLEVDEAPARKLRGYLGAIRKGNFLAVYARSEWEAVQAASLVKVQWSTWRGLPAQETMMQTWREQPVARVEPRPSRGDVEAGMKQATRTVKASYEFGIHSHASLGPSCAVAKADEAGLEIWSPSQATHSLQNEIALMLGIARTKVQLRYVEGSGCYGRNGHEDCTADAALAATLLREKTGRPATVRLQWSRDDEHGWDPKSPPTVMDLEAGLDAQNAVTAWKSRFLVALQVGTLDEFPLLAAVHSGVARKGSYTGNIAHNSDVEYTFPATLTRVDRVTNYFLRTAHLRTPGRMQNNYANESFFDELAFAAGKDPVQMRLEYLKDERSRAVVEGAARLAGWEPRAPASRLGTGPIVRGRGFSYVRYQNESTYVAMACDVVVDKRTGKVRVERVCCSHDCGQVINPDGLVNQVEGQIVQTISRTLLEEVRFDASRVTSTDWASYPILAFPDVPKIEVEIINRPDAPPWGAGEMAAAITPAAVGNAIHDALGLRLRTVPFTPQRVLAALKA